MAKLLIIYHSQSGNTEEMAKAVYEGALSAKATVRLKKAAEATSDDFLGCDAVILGSPNYFSYMAGAVKDFFDRAWYALKDKVNDKPYALFGSHGTGGAKALDTLNDMCVKLELKKAAETVAALREPSPEVLEECKELGRKLAQS